VRRLSLLLSLLPVVACERVLDIPPEETRRFTFDATAEGWADFSQFDRSLVVATVDQMRGIDSRNVLHAVVPFSGSGAAEVGYRFSPALDLVGKTMSASFKVSGLPGLYLKLFEAPEKSEPENPSCVTDTNTDSTFCPGMNNGDLHREEWSSVSFTIPSKKSVSTIGIQLGISADANVQAGTADLYVDTVEIR